MAAVNTTHAVSTTSSMLPILDSAQVLHVTNMGTVPVTLAIGDSTAVFWSWVILPEQYSSFSIWVDKYLVWKVATITQSGTSNLAIFYV